MTQVLCQQAAKSVSQRTQVLWDFFATHKLLLAPMAGVTDKAFRSLCREAGAQLTYTEMVSSKALSFNNKKTQELLLLAPNEDRVAVQIFGHEPATMAQQAKELELRMGKTLAYIDINMGCPARKITSKGDGSALMKSPELAQEIVSAVSQAVSVPVTVKFRRGYELNQESCVSFALAVQEAGANAVCVHGRFAKQLYKGFSDISAIARVVKALDIPVIGNGDIKSLVDAKRMFEETGCAAIMVGRAACGNPWIFTELAHGISSEAPLINSSPDWYERLDMARRHARILHDYEPSALVRMRKHAMWYFAGMPEASVCRAQISKCESLADFDAVFNQMQSFINLHHQRRAFYEANPQASFHAFEDTQKNSASVFSGGTY